MKFTIVDRVRWSDVDRAGIIYYSRFQRFFEIAENELFRTVELPYQELMEGLKILFPRVSIHFDFRKPLKLDDKIVVSVAVGRFGTKSLTLVFEVHRQKDAVLAAEGRIVLACVTHPGFEPVAIPQAVKDRLAPYLLPNSTLD